MSALRKPQIPATMTGGHRWKFIFELMASDIEMSADAGWLLCTLLMHHGKDRLVNPGIRRLSHMTRMTNERVIAAWKELEKIGLITCEIGTGTRSNVYHLVALDTWYAEWVAARSSVRESASSVRESASSVQPVRTNPTEPSKQEEKKASPDLRIVPQKGWEALKFKATDEQRRWLDLMTVDKVEGGCTFLSTTNRAALDRVREMLRQELRNVAEVCGVSSDNVKMRCIASPVSSEEAPTVPLTARGQDQMADRLEAASDGPIEPMPPVYGPNVVSLSAHRTKIQPSTEDTSEDPDDQRS